MERNEVFFMYENAWILPKKIRYYLAEITPVTEIKALIESSMDLKKDNMHFTIVEENSITSFCKDAMTVENLVNGDG